MSDTKHSAPINLTSVELKDYIDTQHEGDYLLIDVRQPMEYRSGHIPGAKFVPLPELESRFSELPSARDLIFYCRSGSRSMAAALFARETGVAGGRIYNLAGGIIGWHGKTLEDFPKIQVFDRVADFPDMLYKAMDLEKGAWRFYHYILERFSSEAYMPVFEELSQAETAHAKTIYGYWKKSQQQPPPFDQVFDALGGEILEGGESLDDLLYRLESIEGNTCLNLIELSLYIEYSAFDLYRTIAEDTPDSKARKAFLSIAQSEKGHMRALTRAIEMCRK